ncbi:putative acyl-CoA synthetase YngI [Candidatus Sulfotelmatomonas gaucii]|uniref:Putative acyl-CoA synthetase YngI n=1 Tax=Candidatus Sulfuritelmatomonas gaucii TaxID=2043161 RepID=A0A2N9L4F1_9BACT|nr:putative acyl-CoA synthetase YngI [Candidatus Sulfotelmatomonas gaucii]
MPVDEQISTQSYARGPAKPLLELTIGDLLHRTASRYPDRLAVASRHQDRRLTWAGLSDEADRVARGLWALGVQRGDRVGLWSTNCIEWIVMHMGCARAGAALVNVNPAYRSHELQFTLTRSRMKALFLWHKDKRADYEEILGRARHGLDLALQHTIYFDSPEWPAFLDAEGLLPDHVAEDDVANIQYTSGTTGLPKGVMLTHHNVVNNGQYLAQGFHYTEQDKIVVPVPLFHCYGCVIGTMSAVNSGAAIILPNWTFDARATLKAVHDERATSVYGVPAMYVAEFGLDDFASYDTTCLRTGMMSGAPCPVELMKRVLEEMHCRELVIAYGQTETSPVVTMSDAADSLEVRVNTVGRAMPQTEIKIAALEAQPDAPIEMRETLPYGQQGEVCVRGYALMKGYDGDPEGTAQVIQADGWLRTGDLGVMREDGCIHITGRSRDVIIRGGENIYPREVEEFLYTHPKVGEVQVIGIPNARLGEIVVAWIRLRPGMEATEEEIRAFCQGQIAYYKIPEHVRIVTEFPATLSGKIQKYKMREFEIEARGLQDVAKTATA